MIIYILTWYLALFVLGIFGFALTSKIFPKFHDKGYGVAKIVSLLLITYIFWILNISPSSLVLWLVIGGFIIYSFYSGILKLSDFKFNLRIIVIEELLFIILFGALLWFRTAVPRIEGIEKFMDFAIINGLLRSGTRPPEDVWYSGNSINYYYFGHLVCANLVRLTQIPSSIAYNLLVATIFSLSGLASFSIIQQLSKKYLFSIFGMLLLLVAGNLDLYYQEVYLKNTNYFYAEARSIIEFTINEFPAYSFLISDLHAHILSIPFTLLIIAFILNKFFYYDQYSKKYFYLIFIVSLGALFAINSWDFLMYAPLFILFSLVHIYLKYGLNWRLLINKFIDAVVVVAASVLIYLPYYLHFKPATYGVSYIFDAFTLLQNLRMFGYFFLCTFPLLIWIVVSKKNLKKLFNPKFTFTVIMTLYALFLVIVPQMISLNDIYFKLNPPYARANTVFKIWYQSWIIYSLITPICLILFYENFKNKIFKWLFGSVLLFFTFYVFKYPVISVKYIVGPDYQNNGLDGASYLYPEYMDEWKMIAWINNNIKGQPVVLEAHGDSYTMNSLISSYTGLPTLVGWASHELGWRGDWDPIANRMGDVEKMYKSESAEEVYTLYKKYKVKYVAITYRELEQYGPFQNKGFLRLTKPIYQSGDAVLLEVL